MSYVDYNGVQSFFNEVKKQVNDYVGDGFTVDIDFKTPSGYYQTRYDLDKCRVVFNIKHNSLFHEKKQFERKWCSLGKSTPEQIQNKLNSIGEHFGLIKKKREEEEVESHNTYKQMLSILKVELNDINFVLEKDEYISRYNPEQYFVRFLDTNNTIEVKPVFDDKGSVVSIDKVSVVVKMDIRDAVDFINK